MEFTLLIVVSVGAGLALLWYLLRRRSAAPASAELAGDPWLARPEWAEPEIDSGAKPTLVIAWILAVVWNLIAVPTGVMSIRSLLGGGEFSLVSLVPLLFPLVGTGLLVWALRETIAWRRFGRTTFVMDPHPGAIGGQVGGTLDARVPYDPNLKFRVELTCFRSHMSGSGRDRKRRESVVWQTHGFAHAAPGAEGTRLEVLFDVEDGLPASELQDSEEYHLWRLYVEAALPGVDFERTFEIPVFPTAEQARYLRRLSTEHRAAEEERKSAIAGVLEVHEIPGGIELFYPAFRKPGAKLMGLLIGAVFVGVFVFTAGTDTPLLFRLLFGGVGGLSVLASFYLLCVSLRVRIDAAGLETRKRLLGLPAGGETFPRDEISGLALKQSYTQSGGKKHTVYFKLQALTGSGKAVTIGYNLTGRETAREALDALSELTGIPVAGTLERNALA